MNLNVMIYTSREQYPNACATCALNEVKYFYATAGSLP